MTATGKKIERNFQYYVLFFSYLLCLFACLWQKNSQNVFFFPSKDVSHAQACVKQASSSSSSREKSKESATKVQFSRRHELLDHLIRDFGASTLMVGDEIL